MLISFLDCSLLIYRNTTDCCMLILCPATLLTLLIHSSRFLVEYVEFSIYRIMSFVKRDSFARSFLNRISFISFSFLLAVARISSKMLNSSSKGGCPCLGLDLRGEASVFHH